MNDKLKKYVTQNRKDFDDQVPSPAVWEAISQELPQVQAKPKRNNIIKLNTRFLWMAAAVFIGAVVTIGYQGATIKQLKTGSVAVVTESDDTAEEPWELPSDLQNLDQVYVQQVNTTMDLLESYPEEAEELRDELKDLDAEFDALKAELGHEYSSEEVLQAMIENYQFKLELLERTLEHFKRTDQIIEEDENEML